MFQILSCRHTLAALALGTRHPLELGVRAGGRSRLPAPACPEWRTTFSSGTPFQTLRQECRAHLCRWPRAEHHSMCKIGARIGPLACGAVDAIVRILAYRCGCC